jgi:D-amino peptidase
VTLSGEVRQAAEYEHEPEQEHEGNVKIFMLWDMEGVCGIYRREQVWFWEEGVSDQVREEGRDLLIADINSAARAALDAGVDELIICDTHHGGGNIVIDRMLQDPRITYLGKSRGEQDGVVRWLPGLDESVDGFMVPGHHAKAGTAGAFLPHTWTLEWADFRINGLSVGEMGIEACFAGHWEIPVALMEGDTTACREAGEQFPGIVTAEVKRPVSRDECTGPAPEEARDLMAGKVAEAIGRLRAGECRPFSPALPMAVAVRMRSVDKAEAAAARPGVRRLDDLTVEAVLDRRADVVKWINDTGIP